jgi:hypothetical protein
MGVSQVKILIFIVQTMGAGMLLGVLALLKQYKFEINGEVVDSIA